MEVQVSSGTRGTEVEKVATVSLCPVVHSGKKHKWALLAAVVVVYLNHKNTSLLEYVN